MISSSWDLQPGAQKGGNDAPARAPEKGRKIRPHLQDCPRSHRQARQPQHVVSGDQPERASRKSITMGSGLEGRAKAIEAAEGVAKRLRSSATQHPQAAPQRPSKPTFVAFAKGWYQDNQNRWSPRNRDPLRSNPAAARRTPRHLPAADRPGKPEPGQAAPAGSFEEPLPCPGRGGSCGVSAASSRRQSIPVSSGTTRPGGF